MAMAAVYSREPFKRSSSLPTMLPSEMPEGPGPIRPVGADDDDEPEEELKGQLEIEEKVEDIIAQEGETVLFECKVVQDLKPTCTWHKDGCTIQSDDERISVIRNSAWHRLEIKHVTTSDQGIYTIECRHSDRYISVKGHLYVAPRPINDGVFYHKIKYLGNAVIQFLRNIKVYRGEKIYLEAKFRYASEKFVWYKNNDVILNDSRTVLKSCTTCASLTINNARAKDAGIYYVVGRSYQGYVSSFADVEVGDANERRQHLPIIDEDLPDEVETVSGEEVRLIIKAYTDEYTIVNWKRNSKENFTNDCRRVDYGNNYFGLVFSRPTISSAGEYHVVMTSFSTIQRVVATSTRLTVTPPIINDAKATLVRPMESAVACVGAKVSFDCRYDLKDFVYHYVVWYVGHYKVERTNSLFNVISNGGQYLLYIKKLEPSMAGDVICELRRAYPNRKSVMMKRTYARLVVVPLIMIQEAKVRPVLDGKLYYEKDADDICIRIEDINGDTRGLPVAEDVDFLLQIVYCRLDDEGLYFVHAVRGPETATVTTLKVFNKTADGQNTVVLQWNANIVANDSWFCIELVQADGSFAEAGVTSKSHFTVEDPPIDRMMNFRITAIGPMSNTYDSEVYIIPPPEIVMRLSIPHEIEPMEAFDAKYKKTNDIIGSGAFGTVELVKDTINNVHFAAKFVKARTKKKRENILREFQIMKNLRHPKLIELGGFYELDVAFVFVMEFCWGGELFDRVVGEVYLKEVDVVGYVRQICEGLEYMHQKCIVHLDLKPENIMCISPNSRQVKLIDFGLARNVNEDFSRAIYGTRDYMAPEVIDYEPITTASDMWSLGVVTYTLLSGVMPFAGESWVERSVNITRARYDYDDYAFDEVSSLAKNFVDHLLLRRPGMRMSATKALQHKWLVEGPRGTKAKHMNIMRQNLKSYLADYRLRWQRAGNVMIAAHRLRKKALQESSGESTSSVGKSTPSSGEITPSTQFGSKTPAVCGTREPIQ